MFVCVCVFSWERHVHSSWLVQRLGAQSNKQLHRERGLTSVTVSFCVRRGMCFLFFFFDVRANKRHVADDAGAASKPNTVLDFHPR